MTPATSYRQVTSAADTGTGTQLFITVKQSTRKKDALPDELLTNGRGQEGVRSVISRREVMTEKWIKSDFTRAAHTMHNYIPVWL